MAVDELGQLQQNNPIGGANEYDALVSEQFGDQKRQIQGSMAVAAKRDPARSAQVLDLSQKMNLPTSIVERNYDDLAKQSADKTTDYDRLINETPGLAKWLETPDNAAIGKDDLEHLGTIDKSAQALRRSTTAIGKQTGELGQAVETGWRGLESSMWHLGAAYGLTTPEEAAAKVAAANTRGEELRKLAPDYSQEFNAAMERESGDVNKAFGRFTGSWKELRDGQILNALKDFTGGGVQTVGETLDMVGAAAARPRGLAYSTAENAANSLPSLALGAAGAYVGGVPGMVAGQFAGEVPTEIGSWINQELAARGVNTSDPQALTAAYKDAKLMADIRAQAERKGLATATVDSIFNAFAGKFVAGAPKGAGVASKVARGAADIGVQAVGEVASEYGGQVAARKGIEGTNFGEAIQEGITSLGQSVGETAVGTSIRSEYHTQPARAAEEIANDTKTALKGIHEAQSLAGIGDAIQQLKNAGNVPGKIAELLQNSGAPQAVYFQTKDWDSYWRSKGKSPAKAAEQMMADGGKAYFEAKLTGQEIEIPFGQYVEATAKTEDFNGLLPSAKVSPDSMSLNESREHLASLPATLKQLAEEAHPTEQQITAEQSAAEVGKSVAEQLREVGVDPQQAILYQEGFRVLGERMGIDPKELFEQYKLRISSQIPGGEGQVLDQAQKPPARSILFPVKTLEGGTLSVAPAANMSASGRVVGTEMFLDSINTQVEYGGVTQDMLKSLERAAVAKGAEKFTVVTEGLPDNVIKALQARGFKEEQTERGPVYAKDLTVLQDERQYEQAGEQGPLGQIQISPEGINIGISKNANASTFFHETGHFYLEVLKDLAARENAPEQIKQDWQTIRDWVGAKDGEELTVDQHEQFARGFESWILDGKAPSNKLAQAFQRFKVWLLSVYKRMRPDVEFSREVREVMNRIFASDEEIADMQAEFKPLFEDPAATGLSPKQAERYMVARHDARVEAEEQLTKKLIDDYRQQEKAFYKEKRDGVRDEVEQELMNTREYKALATLQSKLPGGENNPTFKISQSSLKEIGAKNMPRGISSKDGLHVEVAATLLNYQDGAALVKAMSGLPSLKDAVEKLTDSRMAEFYPDSLVDGTLSQETIKAVHSEKREHLLRMELEILAKENMPALKDVIRKISRRVPTQAQVREEATRLIGNTKAADIRPYLFQRAEVKASREAGEALARGDIDAAFEAKQRELLNYELYRQAQAASENMDKAIADFRKFNQSDEKIAKNRNIDLVDAGRAILAAFGIGPSGSDQYLAQEVLSKIQKYDPETYDVARTIFEDATENGIGPWQSMRYDDFVAMQNSVDALWDLSKNVNQIEIEGKKMDLESIKSQLIEQSNKFIDTKNQKQYTETAGPWAKLKSRMLSARADLIRIEHWAEAMDATGDKQFTNFVFRPISDAVTKYRLQKNEVIKKFHEILKSHEKNLSRDPIESDELGHRFKNKAELLMAVLHTGNESNMRKLLVGRGWGTVNEEGHLDTSRWDQFIDRMQKAGVLTKADYDFAQKIWDLMESLKPGAQKAHKDMYGYYFKEITADGLSTPFGNYRGGYIPAKLDVNESEDADIRQEREQFEKNNNSYQFPTTGRGFTKTRVEQYAGPLSLDMNMLGGHIDSVLRFTNIEPRVKEVARVVMDKEFRAALRQIDPAVAKDALIPWLQRAAQQQVVAPSRTGLGRLTDAVASKLRSGVAMQVMFGNITNALQQLTGGIVAATKIRPKHLRNALVQYTFNPKAMSADIMEKSDWMRSTQGTNTFETAQAIQQIIVQPSTFESIQEFTKKHTYFLQSAFQNYVNNVVWLAGYNQALEQGKTEAQAIKEADSKVRTTQGTVNPEDVSRFETGTQTERLFKQFVGYFNMLANLNAFEIQKIARETGLKKGAGRAFYVYLMGLMLPAVLSEMIVRAMSGEGFDEDDDDFYLDDALEIFFGSQFKTAAASAPYGGQVAVSAYNRFNNKRFDDRLSLSPVLSVVESTAGVPHALYQNIHDDVDNEKQIAKDTLTLIGIMSSLPTGPIGKPVGYVMDVESGRAQPTGPVDFTRGLVTGRSGQQ